MNEKEEEVGEFIGKIRTCNSNTTSESMMINMRSRSISDHGGERGMTVVTKTTANFHSYEEKWTQWLVRPYTDILKKKIYYYYSE